MRAILLLTSLLLLSCTTTPPPPPTPVDGPVEGAVKKAPPAPKPIDWADRLGGSTWEPVKMTKNPSGIYHILDIAEAPGKALAVATFGRGMYVSVDGGRKWRNFDKPRKASKRKQDDPKEPGISIKSNYIGGLSLDWPFMWARSIGHGFGVMHLNKRTWQWWSSKQLDKEYLFPTGQAIAKGALTIATTDGLWTTPNGGKTFTKIGPAQGLPSEYVISYARVDDAASKLAGEWIGLLIGLHHKPASGPARTLTTADGLPDNKIQGVHVNGDQLWVRTDAGLGLSTDAGKTWKTIDARRGLPSDHVLDMAFAGNAVWAATSRGLAAIDPGAAEAAAVYQNGAAPLQNFVNAVHVDATGRLLAGTSDGLWAVTPNDTAAAAAAVACTVDSVAKARQHPSWPRPISTDFNHLVDQTYQYGQTWGGQFGVHKGVEFNNAEGTPVMAVAKGVVTFADFSKRGTGVVTVRHDAKHGGKFIYSLYLHLSGFTVKQGDRVEPGKPVGTVGHTGPATNDHLHFEVRMSDAEGDGMTGAQAINPTPFLTPLPGRGMIAGLVRKQGKRIKGARVYGPIVPEPQETPFGFYEAYGKNTAPDPVLGEDFAIIDVPAGLYPLQVTVKNQRVTRCVNVEPGKIAWVEFNF